MSGAPEVLVIGVGSPDAGDDAIGPRVAAAVARLDVSGIEVLAHEDPTDLPLLWRGRRHVVVVDAVRSRTLPGTVLTVDAAAGTLPPSGRSAGTHDFGLATSIGLSRALGTLPDRLTVVGVEGAAFRPGDPLTTAVEAAIGDAVAAVLRAARAEVST